MLKASSAGTLSMHLDSVFFYEDHCNCDAPKDPETTSQEYVHVFSVLKKHLPLTMAVIITKGETENCTESRISHPMAS